MEDSKSLDQLNEIQDKNIIKEGIEIKNKEPESIENSDDELTQNKNLKINITADNNHKENKNILEDNKNKELTTKLNLNSDKGNNNIKKRNNELIKEKTTEDSKSSVEEPNSNTSTTNSSENVDKVDKEKNLTENKKTISEVKSINIDKKNTKEITTTIPVKAKAKPVKEPPIEKKPFLEFVNNYLIPEIKNEFKRKGKVVNKINLQKTHRPIAEDICWVIYCEIDDTCNFWLSFERDDITSLKSFSLCKNYEKPSIIESFLIDEKKITLKLIISRILQRLNGQKLIGAN